MCLVLLPQKHGGEGKDSVNDALCLSIHERPAARGAGAAAAAGQAWANYGLGATSGPFGFLFRPAKLPNDKESILIGSLQIGTFHLKESFQ